MSVRLIDGKMAVVAVISLMSSFGSVVALANLGTGIQNTLATGNRVIDILDEEPIVTEVTGAKDIDYSGAKSDSVNFAYGDLY